MQPCTGWWSLFLTLGLLHMYLTAPPRSDCPHGGTVLYVGYEIKDADDVGEASHPSLPAPMAVGTRTLPNMSY